MPRPLLAAFGAMTIASALIPTSAQAQDRYLSEVFTTGATFCPRGTLPADGRLLQISDNTALFALIGTLYGGDGRTTFALPDLRGALAARTAEGKLAEVRYCIVTQGIFPSRP